MKTIATSLVASFLLLNSLIVLGDPETKPEFKIEAVPAGERFELSLFSDVYYVGKTRSEADTKQLAEADYRVRCESAKRLAFVNHMVPTHREFIPGRVEKTKAMLGSPFETPDCPAPKFQEFGKLAVQAHAKLVFRMKAEPELPPEDADRKLYHVTAKVKLDPYNFYSLDGSHAQLMRSWNRACLQNEQNGGATLFTYCEGLGLAEHPVRGDGPGAGGFFYEGTVHAFVLAYEDHRMDLVDRKGADGWSLEAENSALLAKPKVDEGSEVAYRFCAPWTSTDSKCAVVSHRFRDNRREFARCRGKAPAFKAFADRTVWVQIFKSADLGEFVEVTIDDARSTSGGSHKGKISDDGKSFLPNPKAFELTTDANFRVQAENVKATFDPIVMFGFDGEEKIDLVCSVK